MGIQVILMQEAKKSTFMNNVAIICSIQFSSNCIGIFGTLIHKFIIQSFIAPIRSCKHVVLPFIQNARSQHY